MLVCTFHIKPPLHCRSPICGRAIARTLPLLAGGAGGRIRGQALDAVDKSFRAVTGGGSDEQSESSAVSDVGGSAVPVKCNWYALTASTGMIGAPGPLTTGQRT